ncbi:MAG TPA: MerR family transcriptional regulator [Bryobacteraceae bacterium]|nr:MerR family transcriptional regulator [Bryobacteraceae bacterium]
MSEIPPNRDDVAAAPEIPDKLFFRIGEVSQIVGVEAYVLRYWESEFPGLSPRKSSTGQRMFRRKDVELLLRIKHLLYSQKFTIEGARKALQEKSRTAARPATPPAQPSLFAANPLPEIRRQVQEILQLLAQSEAA